MYTEKRQAMRAAIVEDVYYSRCFYDQDFVPRWSKEVQTQSVNESPGGICIYTQRHLPNGTRLRMVSPEWNAKREGTVRWSRSSGPGRFKTGLSFRLVGE